MTTSTARRAAQSTAFGLAAAALAAGVCVAQERGVTCLIEPTDLIKLSASAEGVVARLAVERGDSVRAGDVVAELEAEVERTSLRLAVARAANVSDIAAREAQLAFREKQLRRNERLRERSAVSTAAMEETALEAEVARRNLEQARLNREIAQLEARQAEAVLNRRTIKSPIDGVVLERLLSPGEYMDEQAHIVTIAQLDPLRVEAFAPIELFDQIAVGDKATIRPEAPIGGAHEATVTIVDSVLDASTATFGVRLELKNPDFAIPAGLRCDIAFSAN